MTEVTIVECPRDAWQGLPIQIPSDVKAAYLGKLIEAGFKHIDAVSFVSPKAVPQMADSEAVLDLLPPSEEIDLIGVVVNTKGAERAVSTKVVRTLGFPYSVSPTFLRRNQNQDPESCLRTLDSVTAIARRAEVNAIAYISMAFGNPYGDPWDVEEVIDACHAVANSGVTGILLADTVGLAEPAQIANVITAVNESAKAFAFGVHLHARPNEAADKIRAAYAAGCRHFDAAISGLGGCPFAQDSLVGNIATETLISTLQELGATIDSLGPLDPLIRANSEIASKYGG